jgi:sugar lactone lactonase YvrE
MLRTPPLLLFTLISVLIPQSVLSAPGDIVTVAGGGVGDGSAATAAFLYHPNSVAVDRSGNVYVADTGNQRIRKVAAGTGIISTVAGNGYRGYSGDSGAAVTARLKDPPGAAVDRSGNLYIADRSNHRIRKVAADTGIITTVAGIGTGGYSGDNGPATEAALNNPDGVAVDSAGNLYICDYGNNKIRIVYADTGKIFTIAGSGTSGYSGDNGPAPDAALNGPNGVAVDSVGNLYISDYGNHRVRMVTADKWIISTVAGTGTPGYFGDESQATAAWLSGPTGVAVDSVGNLFIVDQMNARVRKVAVGTGIITTVAGDGTHGYAGDNGPATSARINSPFGIAVDGQGNLYIGDGGNDRIRKVSSGDGTISTLAGNGAPGYADDTGPSGYSGDQGAATQATLYQPHNVCVDRNGNQYIADSNNHRIRKVSAGTGIITTLAGNGTAGYSGDRGPAVAASLNYPIGIAVDSTGNVYFSDYFNQRVRQVAVDTGLISTVAGNGNQGYDADNGPATETRLNYPWGIATDQHDNLYIADTGNQRIRKVAAGTGIITTVAGNGMARYFGDNGPATLASLNNPEGVAVDSAGNIYIADYDNQRVRKVTVSDGAITTLAGNGVPGYAGDNGPATEARLSGPSGVAVDNAGNLFIADHFNERVRKVTADGTMFTVAGNGQGGYFGDNGPATAATLSFPLGVALDFAGNLYIADSQSSRIRMVYGNSPPFLNGDVNRDMAVNVFDALLTLQYAVGLNKPADEPTFKSLADVAPLDAGKPKGDGTVDVFDALAILRHAVGLDRW